MLLSLKTISCPSTERTLSYSTCKCPSNNSPKTCDREAASDPKSYTHKTHRKATGFAEQHSGPLACWRKQDWTPKNGLDGKTERRAVAPLTNAISAVHKETDPKVQLQVAPTEDGKRRRAHDLGSTHPPRLTRKGAPCSCCNLCAGQTGIQIWLR